MYTCYIPIDSSNLFNPLILKIPHNFALPSNSRRCIRGGLQVPRLDVGKTLCRPHASHSLENLSAPTLELLRTQPVLTTGPTEVRPRINAIASTPTNCATVNRSNGDQAQPADSKEPFPQGLVCALQRYSYIDMLTFSGNATSACTSTR
jgi:hypothetical protein